ncbi:rhomboid family intramembrane serine protease [candidate division LCP-89 bacterium B3_LCP]|uniref:Rhomboid family intramembrane serine protease n=1 Tax=candidate division LCP-89 bacterium B3_LCP TaxID=2012998 RepID=A0A532V0L0_UNCL8|nr:MAG: rhomboid family intramembrane serine protease [candidate division LCP-89 bacterium B3_LCP]
MNRARSYSIGFGSPWTPAVKALIIINGAVYIAQEFLGFPSIRIFGLVPYDVLHKGAFWQLATYMFLHGGFMHVAFNMFALWMFGSQLERVWGTRQFVKYYFITGIGAGLINVAFSSGSLIPTIGASGAIFGLLLAYGVLFPNNTILLYFFIPMKAKYFVLLFAVLEFLMARSYTADGVAHFAHLGGMAVGLLYLKGRPLLRRMKGQAAEKRHEHKEAIQVKFDAQKLADIQSIRSEVDYLLGRVSRVGYDNLTEEERKRLEEASQLLRQYTEDKEDLN